MNKIWKKSSEQGAVSIFIVIFTALLVTIIAVSFTQLMVRNQQQATANDLSQRAYDSALAGVEDAKRTLIAKIEKCTPVSPACNTIKAAVSARECNTTIRAGIATKTTDAGGNVEVTVGEPDDNQAYTCVQIQENTPTYQGKLTQGTGTVIPLRTTNADTFNRVRITWFTKADTQGSSTNEPSFPSVAPTVKLPPLSATNWPSTAPPILRAQYIPGGANINNLDNRARTAFLYPENNISTMGTNVVLADVDQRRTINGSGPQQINCVNSFESSGASVYGICQATLRLAADTSSAYLQLAALYNSTSFTIELLNGPDVVNFHGVQPIVDSTGRAGDLFRRVQARVTVKDGISLPYPDAAVSTEGNLCKSFFITDKSSDYNPGGCEP